MEKKEQQNINRITYGDDDNQFGDLRLPKTDGPHPVAIVIHGGFWRSVVGLDIMDDVADDLTSRGIATWNIEYRRVGQTGGGWPGTFIDVARAADHLHTLAESHHLDLSRIVTIGHSAGGHLALWLAARHHLPVDSVLRTSDEPLRVKGTVSLAGVNDLAAMLEVHQIRKVSQHLQENSPVHDLLDGTPGELPDRYAQVSPIDMLPIGVPQVLIHGALDINVPIGVSHNYKNAADQQGDNVKMVELSDAEHFKLIDPQSEAWSTIAKETLGLFDVIH